MDRTLSLLVGIAPVLPTPFSASGSIDPEALARLVAFALAGSVNAIVFPGFASEVDDLTDEERRTLLGLVVRCVDGRVPVVAGASAPSAERAAEQAATARDLGVAYAMIQAPKSVGAGAEAVAGFYRAVTEAVPGIEIVLQNAPAPRGSDLAPEAVLAIVRGNPAITYVKEETLPAGRAISAILAGRPSHLKGVIGGGGARYILDEYRRGSCGAMPAAELADVHVALDRAYRGGDLALARDLYRRTLPLLVMQANFRMALTKQVLVRRGVLANAACRAKLPPMDAIDLAEIDAWLAEIADLLPSAVDSGPR